MVTKLLIGECVNKSIFVNFIFENLDFNISYLMYSHDDYLIKDLNQKISSLCINFETTEVCGHINRS